jgi:NADP-dependent 3-hydroxy acid dehydrogenase YdfG
MATFAPHPDRRPALVTGASSGIGEAVARRLAAQGHPVALGARRVERCEQVAAELTDAGAEAVALPLDLTDPDSVKRFAVAAEEALGQAEVVVASAGDAAAAPALGTDPAAFARLIDVNLLGAHRLLHLVAPGMVERRRGDVVLVTSDIVVEPRPHMAAYMASKWGLEGLATALRMELEGTGVRVSVVRPGPTATGMGSEWEPEAFARLVEAWSRWGVARHDHFLHPDAVADAVAYMVATPRGVHVRALEVEPEAPIEGGSS